MISGITVKVCGITQPEQAAAMLPMGVDLIGVNFVHSSPRRVSPDRGADIVRAIGKPDKVVGVFQDPESAWVEKCIEHAGIGMLQFHGNESSAFCESFGMPYIRVIHMGPEFNPDQLDIGEAKWLLFDAKKGTQRGGTGLAFDWSLLSRMPRNLPWMLAGGLGPNNITDAIHSVRPDAVDLNSKIEAGQPGWKDLSLLQQCLGHMALKQA